MDNLNTEPPKTLPSINSSNKFYTWFFIFLLIVAIGLSGFFYYQNLQLKQELIKKQELPITSLTPTPIISTTILSPTINQLLDQKEINYPKLPIVVFEPPLSNKDYNIQKEEIQQKIVNPYVEYYKYAYGNNYLVSLSIQIQTNEAIKSQYPYSLYGIMSNGGIHEEALMQKDNKLSWWIPTCMGPCIYSEEFKIKYPQIVSQTNP